MTTEYVPLLQKKGYDMDDYTVSWRSPENIKYIVLHHSGSNAGNVEQFRRQHKAWGWSDVGYHFIITNGNGGPDGEIQAGRDVLLTGAHCYGRRNFDSIGICLVGDFTKGEPTFKQMAALYDLLSQLVKKYHIPIENINGHKAFCATACPGNLDIQAIRQKLVRATPDYLKHSLRAQIERCLQLGIMKGYPDGSFKPDQPATRAELATVAVNLYDLLTK